MSKDKKNKLDTQLGLAGRKPADNFGIINPPVYHASTVAFPTVAELEAAELKKFDTTYYGLYGTPTSFALEDGLKKLEDANHAVIVGSGLGSIAVTLAGLLKSGDHLLVTESAYFPTIKFCDNFLKKFGVDVTYYDPMIGENVKDLMRPETRVVFTEAPGSITFEVQDIPAIAKVAHDGGALVVMDNTWSAGYYFKPFDFGVDVSVQAVTKYIGGHSDLMMGSITMRDRGLYDKIMLSASSFGHSPQPDDCYLALRGLRTLATRLKQHNKTGMILAKWLAARPEVEAVIHPAFENCPGHEIWKRDFTGATGLFGVVLKDKYSDAERNRMMEGLELFPIGYSWGGYESLVVQDNPADTRKTYRFPHSGPYMRIHAGLEDPDDLIRDLEQGLALLG